MVYAVFSSIPNLMSGIYFQVTYITPFRSLIPKMSFPCILMKAVLSYLRSMTYILITFKRVSKVVYNSRLALLCVNTNNKVKSSPNEPCLNKPGSFPPCFCLAGQRLQGQVKNISFQFVIGLEVQPPFCSIPNYSEP